MKMAVAVSFFGVMHANVDYIPIPNEFAFGYGLSGSLTGIVAKKAG